MQDITMIDILVVAGACVIAWCVGRYIKRSNERDERDNKDNK